MKKMLIAYYSWSNGNTKAIAEALQKATGADTSVSASTPRAADKYLSAPQAAAGMLKRAKPPEALNPAM